MSKLTYYFLFIFFTILLSPMTYAEKGEPSMLRDKPYFTLYVEATDSHGRIILNGQNISTETGAAVQAEYPVNHWLRAGENDITILLLFGKNKRAIANANCKVSLRVRQSGADPSTSITIATLNYSAALAKSGNGTQGNTPEDKLNSHDNFKSNKHGDVIISMVSLTPVRNKAIEISRKITLPRVSFPKWAFFESDNITNLTVTDIWGQMDNATHDNLVKEILPVYKKIWAAIKNKDIDSIMPYYSERNRELDAAFYNPTGTLLKRLSKALEAAVNDPDRTLRPINEKELTAHVYDNDKLVSLQHTTNKAVISFVYKQGLYEYYDIILRKQGDRWVITR